MAELTHSHNISGTLIGLTPGSAPLTVGLTFSVDGVSFSSVIFDILISNATFDFSIPYTSIDDLRADNVSSEFVVANNSNGLVVSNTGTTWNHFIGITLFSPQSNVFNGGDFVFVENGDLYNNTGWVQTEEVITVGTDSVVWQQFAGAGTYTAGSGLALVGNEFSLNVALTGGLTVIGDELQIVSTAAGTGLTFTSGVFDVVGTTDRITANANSIDIASTYVGQSSITTLGTITTGTWNGNAIGPAYGGLGLSSISANQLLVGAAGNTYTTLSMGTAGQVLQVNSAGTALVYGDIDGGTY